MMDGLQRRRVVFCLGVLGIAACLLASSAAVGWATIEIVAPTHMSQPVGPNSVTFRAEWWVDDENHTAEATWKWTFPTGHTLVEGDPAELMGNPVSTVFRDPGTWNVTVQATRGGQTEELTLTIYAFGGIFQSMSLFWEYRLPLYRPQIDSPVKTFEVRSGQPSGTTYQWTINPGADKAHIVPYTSTTSETVQLQADQPSAEWGDVRLVLLYTHGGRTVTWAEVGQRALDVHKPQRPPSQRTQPSQLFTQTDNQTYWFWCRFVNYQAVSQLGQCLYNIPWHEDYDRYPDDPGLDITTGDGTTLFTGWLDSAWADPAWPQGNGDRYSHTTGTAWNPDDPELVTHIRQYVWFAGWDPEGMWQNEVTMTTAPAIDVASLK